MTRVIVFAGNCGFSTEIIAEKAKDRKIKIKIESGCEMVMAMAREIDTLDIMIAFKDFLNNPVYKAAALHLKHVACPVPAGILKTLEVEAGLCIPKDVSIRFTKEALDGSNNGWQKTCSRD